MSLPVESQPATRNQNRRVILWSVICLLLGFFAGHLLTHHWMRHDFTRFRTPYQAVLLSNGAVYYGKLSGYGGRNPVLNDVFYIVSKTDPESKQVSNVLVKRGKELTARTACTSTRTRSYSSSRSARIPRWRS